MRQLVFGFGSGGEVASTVPLHPEMQKGLASWWRILLGQLLDIAESNAAGPGGEPAGRRHGRLGVPPAGGPRPGVGGGDGIVQMRWWFSETSYARNH